MLNLARCGLVGLAVMAGCLTANQSAWGFQRIHDILEGKVPWPGPAVTSTGAPIEMRFTSPWPPASQLVRLSPDLLKSLERVTGGRILAKAFHAGTLVAMPNGFKAAREDISDFGACYTAVERTMVGSKVFELPGILPPNPAVGTRVMNEVQAKYFKKEYDNFEVYMVPSFQTGTGSHLLTRRPVKTLADLKGVKVAVPVPTFVPIINAWGGVAVPTQFGDLSTSLQQGTTDAVFWLDEAMVPFRLYEHLKFRTFVALNQTTVDLCVNRKWFDRLPKDLQDNVALWAQFAGQAWAQIATMERTSLQPYVDAGVSSYDLPADERERWRQAVRPMVDEWKAAAGRAGYDADRILADIENLKAKYASQPPDDLTRLTAEQPVPGFLKN